MWFRKSTRTPTAIATPFHAAPPEGSFESTKQATARYRTMRMMRVSVASAGIGFDHSRSHRTARQASVAAMGDTAMVQRTQAGASGHTPSKYSRSHFGPSISAGNPARNSGSFHHNP